MYGFQFFELNAGFSQHGLGYFEFFAWHRGGAVSDYDLGDAGVD
jgi:hypothetical protein